MSTDGVQWPSVTADFAYLVELGDYKHFLRPVDQKAADCLSLAKNAVGHVNDARILMTDRGPFLIGEKQQKMDELISDTEEALERVIKFLEPARLEMASEESVRFNPKNAFVLDTNEAKGAATFGRLVTTHKKLLTVLHDLQHIEATAQLDDCEVRANTVVLSTPPPSAGGINFIASESPTAQHVRRTSRHAPSSKASSVSGFIADDSISIDTRSPISNNGNALLMDTSLVQSSLPIHDSTASHGGLSTIHELDTAHAKTSNQQNLQGKISATAIPSVPKDIDQQSIGSHVEKSEAQIMPIHRAEASKIEINSSPVKKTSTIEQAASSPGLRQTDHTDYVDFRQKAKQHRLSLSESSGKKDAIAMPRATGVPVHENYKDNTDFQEVQLPMQEKTEKVMIQASEHSRVDQSSPTKQAEQTKVDAVPAEKKPSQLLPIQETDNLTDNQLSSQDVSGQRTTIEPGNLSQTSTKDISISPAVQITGDDVQRQNSPNPSKTSNIVSPSRLQSSPETQTPRNAHPLPRSDAILRRISTKSFDIVQIDETLTRLPSLLRAGHKQSDESRNQHKLNGIGHDHEILFGEKNSDIGNQANKSNHTNVLDSTRYPTSCQAQPLPLPSMVNGHSPDLQTPRHRSLSDTVVPSIHVRPPTIPRKPVGYRKILAAIPSENAAALTSHPNPSIPGASTLPTSHPPIQSMVSPWGSVQEHDHLISNRSAKPASIQNLLVKTQSSPVGSRNSSVSAEDINEVRYAQERQQANPLTHNPTFPVSSTIEDKPANNVNRDVSPVPFQRPVQRQSPPPHPSQSPPPVPPSIEQQIDYRSPAFQQSYYHVHRPVSAMMYDTNLNSQTDPVSPQQHRDVPSPVSSPPRTFVPPLGSSIDQRSSFDGISRPPIPIRNNTEPPVQVQHNMYDGSTLGPRRASEQSTSDQQILRMQITSTATQPSNFENAHQFNNMSIERSSGIRTAPPQDNYRSISSSQNEPPPRVASANDHVSSRQANKDLFGRQILKQQVYQDVPQRTAAPPAPRYYAQPNKMPLPSMPRNTVPGPSMRNNEPRRQILEPVNEGEIAQQMVSEPVSFAPEESQPIKAVKKRSSWLAYQATRLKGTSK